MDQRSSARDGSLALCWRAPSDVGVASSHTSCSHEFLSCLCLLLPQSKRHAQQPDEDTNPPAERIHKGPLGPADRLPLHTEAPLPTASISGDDTPSLPCSSLTSYGETSSLLLPLKWPQSGKVLGCNKGCPPAALSGVNAARNVAWVAAAETVKPL